MCKSQKRTYHPLVMYLYFTGKLDSKYIQQIPLTTIHYWKSLNHTSMYGYDWVQQTCDNVQNMELSTTKKMLRTSMFVCGRLIKTISSLQNSHEYTKRARKHAADIVRTIDAISPIISLKKSCKILKISEQQFYRWKNKIYCTASVLNLCFKVHPNQLTTEECAHIQTAVTLKKNEGKARSTIYYHLLRNNTVHVSLSTFYKYANLFESKRTFNKQYFKEANNFRASYAFEYVHIDTTKIYTQNNGWQRAVFVKDNYSKSLLYKTIVPGAGSVYIKDVIKNTFVKYNMFSLTTPVTLISDNGSENKGEVNTWINSKKKKKVCKVISKIDTDISNNMVESANHQFKNMFLKNKPFPKSIEDLQIYLDEFEQYINFEWMPGEFYGLSPHEVLQGEIPNRRKFAKKIKEAKKIRISHNKHISLEQCKVCAELTK